MKTTSFFSLAALLFTLCIAFSSCYMGYYQPRIGYRVCPPRRVYHGGYHHGGHYNNGHGGGYRGHNGGRR